MARARARIAGWVARYLPLEVLGTVAAVVGAWLAYEASASLVVAALVGTVAEGVGYYALAVVRAIRCHLTSQRVRRHEGAARRAVVALGLALRGLAAEFGPAEVLDTVIVRPAMLFGAAAVAGPTPAGWLAGKLAADAVFYLVAIVSFELGRRVILPDGGADTESAPSPDVSALPDRAPAAPRLEAALR
jgi:hypothetical protein